MIWTIIASIRLPPPKVTIAKKVQIRVFSQKNGEILIVFSQQFRNAFLRFPADGANHFEATLEV